MRIKPLFHFVCAASLFAVPSITFGEGLAGAYLAANHANVTNDYAAAAEYYSKALLEDPDDAFILQNALLAYVVTGEMDSAIKLSKEIVKLEFGSQLSDLIIFASHVQNQEYKSAEDVLSKTKDQLSPLLHDLLLGWVLVGQGDMSIASAQFDSMKKPNALQVLGQYHKALAIAMAGDFELADKIFQNEGDGPLHLNRSSVIAHVQIMSQLGKFDEAAKLIKENTKGVSDQLLNDMHDKMRLNQAIPFDFIESPNAGISETFLTLASVLSGEDDERFTLIYARIAEYLRPGSVEALLLLSDILKDQEQYDLATQILAKVPSEHPMYLNAELGRADALVDGGKTDAAIAVLQRLSSSHPDVPRVHMVLGDIYNGDMKYRKANKAYSIAIELLEKENAVQWFLYYARAVSFERLDDWKNAEADFRKALELSPDQPSTLNYLGYSLVEKGIKLEEAQTMIERAVKGRPNDGFITDSLGWLLYRVGKFDEAVAPMERAAELMPTDPVINDHLGDVYWKVGRFREAQFQWSRALSFDPEEKDATRIRRKLEIGLDDVLTAEEATLTNAN
jgi:tetratricopeptide (TPR) repeat protein